MTTIGSSSGIAGSRAVIWASGVIVFPRAPAVLGPKLSNTVSSEMTLAKLNNTVINELGVIVRL
ncbi:hypothetical protein [Legionella shakespearei]|uniref:hypothetical protein n=1 Tax=Legionella shakespearei TaxID=45075 RepID=UPI0014613749|nr:hypothetical protein [Legionella shakespearei]